MKQNVLFILTDQQMLRTIGAYGSTICRTPNIDALGSESVVFDNAYTVCPICTPARASIQTGLYPHKHGMLTNIYTRGTVVHELPNDEMLLSRRILSLGYRAGYTGKWHLGAGRDRSVLGGPEYRWLVDTQAQSGLPSDVGYEGDDFKGHGGIGEAFPAFHAYLEQKGITYEKRVFCDGYPKAAEILSDPDGSVPHFLTDRAIEHIGGFADANQPFFYMLNHWQPHEPYHVPTRYLDLYRDVHIPPWPSFSEDTSGKPFIHNVQRGGIDRSWEVTEEFVRYYFAAVSQIDDEIGRLIAFLRDRGLYENTTIIFSADHGETLHVHNHLADKGLNMYEETTHIPLVIKPARALNVAPGRLPHLVSTCDLYSTILELAGAERSSCERDGLSLLRLLKGNGEWRDTVVCESSGIDNISYTQRMIRWHDVKYVFHSSDLDELYLLDQDPHEMQNLAADPTYFPLAREMRARLREWLGANSDGFLDRFNNLCNAKDRKYA